MIDIERRKIFSNIEEIGSQIISTITATEELVWKDEF